MSASEGAESAPTAGELKDRGNQRFKTGDFPGALALYSQALLQDPQNHLLFANRAACNLRLAQLEDAVADAQKALEFCPEEQQPYVKGFHRLTQALCGLHRYEEAQQAVEKALKGVGGADAAQVEPILKMLTDIDARRTEFEAAQLQKEGIKTGIDPRRKPRVKEFEPVEELGTGNFSTIVRAVHRTTGEEFALKVIHKEDIKKTKRRHPNVDNEIQMEKRVLLRCRGHPNVLYLFHTLQDYHSLYFLTELCSGGELWSKLNFRGRGAGVARSLATFWTAETVRGLSFLHSRGIVHRDLKPENLLIDARGRVKLADFGTAKDLEDASLNGPEFCGTPEYMSPEAICSRDAGASADLWALGCIVFQFLTGYPPFRANSPYLSFLRAKRGQVRFPEHLSQEHDFHARDLVSSLVVLDPDGRLGARDGIDALRLHPFFRSTEDGQERHSNPNPVTIDWAGLESLPCEAHVKVTHVCGAAVNARQAPDLHGEESPVTLPDSALSAIVTQPSEKEAELWNVAADLLDSLHSTGMPEELAARIRALGTYELARLRMVMRQHGKLHERKIWKVVTGGLPLLQTRSWRASLHTREYLGLERQQQGTWDKPFYFVSAQGCAAAERLVQLVQKINALRPAPAFFTFMPTGQSDCSAVKRALFKLNANIPSLVVPGIGDFDIGEMGADWYGFWYHGFRGLVVNSNLLVDPSCDPERAAQMEDWLEEQLEQSKLASQRACVFSAHPWFLQEPCEAEQSFDGGCTVQLPRRVRWLNRFRADEIDLAITSCGDSADLNADVAISAKLEVPEARKDEPSGVPRTRPRYDVKRGEYVTPEGEVIAPVQATAAADGTEDPLQSSGGDAKSASMETAREEAGKAEEDGDDSSDDDDDDDDPDHEGEAKRKTLTCVAMPAIDTVDSPAVLLVTVERYNVRFARHSLQDLPSTISLPVQVDPT